MSLFSAVTGHPPGGGNGGVSVDGVPPPNNDAGAAGSAATASRSDHLHECFVRPTIYFTGQWHQPGWYSAGFAGVTPTYGILYYIPIYVPRTTTYTGIGISVQAAAPAGNVARLGIYNCVGGVPDSLVLDAGVVALYSTGDKIIVISQQLTPGYYFICMVSSHSPTLWSLDVSLAISPPSTGFSGGGVTGGNNVLVSASGRLGDVAGGLADPAPTPTQTRSSADAYVAVKN